jgi:hypothetical protein
MDIICNFIGQEGCASIRALRSMLLTCGLRAPLARIRRSRGRYVASLAPCPPDEARRRCLFPLPPASPSAPSTSQHRGPLPCSRAPPLMTGPFPLCPSSPPSPLARKSFSPPARALPALPLLRRQSRALSSSSPPSACSPPLPAPGPSSAVSASARPRQVQSSSPPARLWPARSARP